MNYYKDILKMQKRIQYGPTWNDYFMLDGKLFGLYEYGEGFGHDYAYFLNKRTGDMIRIEYDCPAFNGGKQTVWYKFHCIEYLKDNYLWR